MGILLRGKIAQAHSYGEKNIQIEDGKEGGRTLRVAEGLRCAVTLALNLDGLLS